MLYKRLANCATREDLQGLEEELIDRFGLPPQPAQVLLETHRLRLATQTLGIIKLEAGDKSVTIQFMPNPPIDPMVLIKLIQTRREYRLAGPDRLRVERGTEGFEARLDLLREVLGRISGQDLPRHQERPVLK